MQVSECEAEGAKQHDPSTGAGAGKRGGAMDGKTVVVVVVRGLGLGLS